MKLQKITAYYVTYNPEGLHLKNTEEYVRFDYKLWYCVDSSTEQLDKVSDFYVKELEKEFQETVNVIHEQLPLL